MLLGKWAHRLPCQPLFYFIEEGTWSPRGLRKIGCNESWESLLLNPEPRLLWCFCCCCFALPILHVWTVSLMCGFESGLLDWDAVLGRVRCQRETEGGQEKLVVLGCLLLGGSGQS